MWFTIMWKVIVQLFYVGVVLWAFSVLQGRLEFIIVALFGLTYGIIRGGQIVGGITFANFALQLQRQLDAIKIVTNPDFIADPQIKNDERRALDALMLTAWIDSCGVSVGSLICLFYLVSTLAA